MIHAIRPVPENYLYQSVVDAVRDDAGHICLALSHLPLSLEPGWAHPPPSWHVTLQSRAQGLSMASLCCPWFFACMCFLLWGSSPCSPQVSAGHCLEELRGLII